MHTAWPRVPSVGRARRIPGQREHSRGPPGPEPAWEARRASWKQPRARAQAAHLEGWENREPCLGRRAQPRRRPGVRVSPQRGGSEICTDPGNPAGTRGVWWPQEVGAGRRAGLDPRGLRADECTARSWGSPPGALQWGRHPACPGSRGRERGGWGGGEEGRGAGGEERWALRPPIGPAPPGPRQPPCLPASICASEGRPARSSERKCFASCYTNIPGP